MMSQSNNSEFSYSWFRDQVLHPRETQHTYEEVNEWLKELSFEIQSTSINKYKSLSNYSLSDLIAEEKNLEIVSIKNNLYDLKFSPGFFTICAKKIL